MNQHLYIFTNAYPFGIGEDFLDSELPIVALSFSSVTIQPMTFGGKRSRRPVPANVKVKWPILSASRLTKLLVGIRDLFRHTDLRHEFFARRTYRSWKCFYNYLLAVVVKSYWNKKRFATGNATIYFYWGFGPGYLVPELKKADNNVVVRLHGGDIYEELSGNYLPLRKSIFNGADKICTASEHGKLYLSKRYPDYAEKMYVSRLGTQDHGPGLFEPDIHKMVLVSCGNLISTKRIGLLAEFMGRQKRNILWHHFGDGTELRRIKTIVAKHPNNIKTILHGRIPNTKLINFYKNNHVDAFVSLSETEGVPVSIMEAMSFGIPVIATDAGGTIEILYFKGTAILPVQLNYADFCNAIEKVGKLAHSQSIREEIKNHWLNTSYAETNYKTFALNMLGLII